jgi:hypothetical protein
VTELEQLEAQLVVLDGQVDAERQAVSRLRRQIEAFRPIPMPAVGCGKPLEGAIVAPLRLLLAAHAKALEEALARRDRVELDRNRLKSGSRP